MQAPVAFFRCAAKAILNHVGFGVAGDLAVEVLPAVAGDLWQWWARGRAAGELRGELEAVAQLPPEQLAKVVERAVAAEAAAQPEEMRRRLTDYLTALPASIRQSQRRPSDPDGRTLSAALVPGSPEELLPLLPARLPRFHPGDRPPGIGDWRLEELLGVGGFGEVWKAKNPNMPAGPTVALKFCLDADALAGLRNEIKLLGRVMAEGKHPGIVALQHTYLDAPFPCLQYEYVNGGTLAGVVRDRQGKLGIDWHQSAKIALGLARIVGFAHCLKPPIVHRDLKPANILLSKNPTPQPPPLRGEGEPNNSPLSASGRGAGGVGLSLRIADFGIGGVVAKQALGRTGDSCSLPTVLRGAHTPLYASPQQRRHPERVDPRDDVYSLGVIWYQLLVGDLSASVPSGDKWKQRLLEQDLPPRLLAVLVACLEEEPTDRHADASQLAEAIDAALHVPTRETVATRSAAPTRAVTMRTTVPPVPVPPRRVADEVVEPERPPAPFPYWALPILGLVMLVALGMLGYLVLPAPRDDRGPNGPPVVTRPAEEDKGKLAFEPPLKDRDGAKDVPVKDNDKGPHVVVDQDKRKLPEGDAERDKGKKLLKKPNDEPKVPRPHEPGHDRVGVGSFVGETMNLPAALLSRRREKTATSDWSALPSKSVIFSSDTLVSLPGFASTMQTDTGVSLTLRGSVPEYAVSPAQTYLMESAVTLHASKAVDLDLTLWRGRLYLVNGKQKGPANIRLRFAGSESWEVTLPEPKDEVGVDLTFHYTPLRTPTEEPHADLHLVAIRGEIRVKMDALVSYTHRATPPEAAVFSWARGQKFEGPRRLATLPPAYDRKPPADTSAHRPGTIKRMEVALRELAKGLAAAKQTDVVILERLADKDDTARLLAIYCLGALDDPSRLLDVVGDEDGNRGADRRAAAVTLQRWLWRGRDQGKRLYDEKAATGVLLDKRYRAAEAKTVLELLYPLPAEMLGKPETFQALAQAAKSPRVAIAELGHMHLGWLSGDVKLPTFNAAWPVEERRKFAQSVLDLVEKKELPPRPVGKEKDGK